jgi:two-component system response regulator DesR
MLVHRASLLRGSLAAVLSTENDMEITAQIARIEAVGPIATAVRPHVAVIDIALLADESSTPAQELTEAVPACAVLVLTDQESVRARGAFEAYVHGFVSTENTPGELAQYIRRVAKGERVIAPALAVAALWALRCPLTERELEVLQIAASGVPSTEIAARLHLSVGTVHNYVSSIIHKTGSRNRLEATRIAKDAGWL